MSKFIVSTLEQVVGRYTVEAENEDKIREIFNGTPRKIREAMENGSTEQTNCMAFSIEVEQITPLPEWMNN